jgi:hypothetical protein
MISGTAKTFYLHVRCPCGDFEDWIILREPVESLEQLLAAPFTFECPVHGVQSEFPLEGSEKRPPRTNQASQSPSLKKLVRSSERRHFHVPVFVYGWSKSNNSFHEDTATLVFNASGALVRLLTPVQMGEDLFLVNKFTREEQQVRVVFFEQDYLRGYRVGLAFQKPVPQFWRMTRRSPRARQSIRVVVRGKDRSGNPFSQTSNTLDISNEGARLDGLASLIAPGDVIELKRRWRGKARFRVAWVGQVGTVQSNQVGISAIDSVRPLWQIKPQNPLKPQKR